MSENKKTPEQLAQEEASKAAEAKKAEALKAAEAKKAEAKKAEEARIKRAQSGSYLPDVKERKLFHVKLDKPAFNPQDGKKLSKAFIQKFTVADWKHFEKNSKGLGYTTEIMWNPEEYK